MIPGLSSHIISLTSQSTQEFASHFQGRLFSSLTQAIQGDRMIEIVKMIASLAVMVLSVIAVVVGMRWFFSQRDAQGLETFDDVSQLNRGLSPLNLWSKVIEKEGEDSFQDFLNSSSYILSPKSLPKHSSPPTFPVTRDLSSSKPIPLPHYSIDITVTPDLKLSSIPETLPLALISDDQISRLKQNLINTYHLIQKLDGQLGPQCPFVRQIPDSSVLSKIHQLGSLPDAAQNYESLATQLHNHLQPYYSFYLSSYISSRLSKSADEIMKDPIRPLFQEIYKENLSLVLGALAQRYFNEGNSDQCVQILKMMTFNQDLITDLYLAVSSHYINQGKFDRALSVLEDCLYKDKREALKLHLAKAYFNQGNLDKALQIANDISYSSNNNEFILNIAKAHYKKGNSEIALKIAQDLTSSSERNEFILNIAKAYFNQSNLEKAFKIADGWISRSERSEFTLNIAKAYFNQNSLEKAFEIADGLTSSSERNEFILNIAKAYLNQNNLEKAFKIADGLTSSTERKELILQIAETYLNQKNPEKAFKIADTLSYSKERDEFILKIACYYYRSGKPQLAIETAESRSYSSERDELIKKIELLHNI